MRIEKPLWLEGVTLAQHHFQQQARWFEYCDRHIARLAVAEPWGIREVLIDEAALETASLKFERLKVWLPDGTLIDSTVADRLPPARDLSAVPSGTQTITVLIALPLLDASGSNCRLDEAELARPRRFYREFVKVPDLHGSEESEIAAERHALRLLFDFEPHEDDAVCPVARLVRNAGGRFEIDHHYVPPCATLSAHPLHIERVRRLSEILLAKSAALGMRRSERVGQIAEFGIADVSLFWLLHSIHTYWPQLGFLASHPDQPPERLYGVLAQFAGVLMTFSTSSQLTQLPAYDHARQDEIFARLETMIRDLLDAIIPSRVIAIGLTRKGPTTWTGQFQDERLTVDADYYLSVSAGLPAFELIDAIPKLCKIGAPDDVEQVVNAALNGIPLRAVQRVPAAIPVRLDNQYFALDAHDPVCVRMLAARVCQVYLPATVPDASLELYAVLRS
jgi:type VI secretion system protein ImpJ